MNENGLLMDEFVNVVLNRLESIFNLEKLKIAPHLQIKERKDGIVNAVIPLYSELKNLV